MKKFIFVLFAILSVFQFTGCPGGCFDDDDDNYTNGLSLSVDKNSYTLTEDITMTLSGIPKFSEQFDITQLKNCSIEFTLSKEDSSDFSKLIFNNESSSNFRLDKFSSSSEDFNCIEGTFSPTSSTINEYAKVKVTETGTYEVTCKLNFLSDSGAYMTSSVYSQKFEVKE